VATCYSYRQYCSLGPIPPRTVGRPDAQVPRDASLGPCRHGKIGSFYFYAAHSKDDPAFGFFDIELSVQQIAPGRARVELYCIADGYQSSRGVGGSHPLRIALGNGGNVLATVEWAYPDVLGGHADPMNFSADIDFDSTSFARLDRIDLEDVQGLAAPCG
jgi:hypothetical protein